MKRLPILIVFGMMWSSLAGCHCWDCMWRGPACQQCPPPAVTYALPVPLPASPPLPAPRARRTRRDPGPGNLRAGAYTLTGRRPTMKKLLALTILGMLLIGATGCQCWRDSWCGRCHPHQTVVVAEPCVVESCSPCGSCGTCGTCGTCGSCGTCGTCSSCASLCESAPPCATCTTPVIVPGPVIAH